MTWSDEQLRRIGGAEELQVSSVRADGTLRPYVTIWVVRAGDGIFVRSAYGANNGWFRRAKASGAGRIKAGGVERDVTFAEAESPDGIDQAYHDKYDRYGPAIVGSVTGADVPTLRLLPR
ncbi:DUF2255 family protein [Actinoplanes sp. CA-054009]